VQALLAQYSTTQLAWIGLCVFLAGMNKGGIPVGAVALPVLILVWPNQVRAAKSVVGFMLPMLCVMDVFAISVYRRHVLWRHVRRLMPGALLGVALASLLFLSGNMALVELSDQWLKLCVGVIGVLFVAYQAARKWVLSHLPAGEESGWLRSLLLGFGAGVTSTLAHAGGPMAQMYFLPQGLDKMNLAGTLVAFFFALNVAKLLPYWLFGMIDGESLALGAVMLPCIPLGVASGYVLVRKIRSQSYVAFIYVVLLLTSILLIAKAFPAGARS